MLIIYAWFQFKNSPLCPLNPGPAPCEPGSFFNLTKNTCQFCPLSQYQDESGQTHCKTCPNGKATKILGATSKEGCISELMKRFL